MPSGFRGVIIPRKLRYFLTRFRENTSLLVIAAAWRRLCFLNCPCSGSPQFSHILENSSLFFKTSFLMIKPSEVVWHSLSLHKCKCVCLCTLESSPQMGACPPWKQTAATFLCSQHTRACFCRKPICWAPLCRIAWDHESAKMCDPPYFKKEKISFLVSSVIF